MIPVELLAKEVQRQGWSKAGPMVFNFITDGRAAGTFSSASQEVEFLRALGLDPAIDDYMMNRVRKGRRRRYGEGFSRMVREVLEG